MLSRAFTLLTIIVGVLASLAPAKPAHSDGPRPLILATGSPGATYYDYGAGLAKLLTRVLDLPVVAQATEGSTENIQLIENGKAQIGLVAMGIAQEAWNGSGNWTRGRQHRELRALFPMYETAFQFVVLKESPIRSLADMAGKRVGTGPETGTAGTYVPRLLSTLGIEATVSYGTWKDLPAQLERGNIDVLAVAASVPSPVITVLEAKHKVAHIAPTQEELLKLRLAFPELTATALPPGSYPSLLAPYQTVGLYNFAVADKDLPNDLAYNIVEAVFTHHEEMLGIDPAAAGTVPENFVRNTFLPYHPGALRFYGNVGGAGVLEQAIAFLQSLTVTIGNFQVSPITVVTRLLWLALLLWLAFWTARILEARVLAHSRLTHSVQLLFARLMKVVFHTEVDPDFGTSGLIGAGSAPSW